MIYDVKCSTKIGRSFCHALDRERFMKIGFDNQKYLKLQSERILELSLIHI